MSINPSEALNIENFGLVATDDNGSPLYYFTGGSGSPVGQAAPLNTVYIDTDSNELWIKCGPDNNKGWEFRTKVPRRFLQGYYLIKENEEYRVRCLSLAANTTLRVEGTLRIG